jgi:5-methylcytosine-specific restriction endonuclease McrA
MRHGKKTISEIQKDRSRCYYCRVSFGRYNLPTIDHIIPKSKGGNNKNLNKILVCDVCNTKKAQWSLEKFKIIVENNPYYHGGNSLQTTLENIDALIRYRNVMDCDLK